MDVFMIICEDMRWNFYTFHMGLHVSKEKAWIGKTNKKNLRMYFQRL